MKLKFVFIIFLLAFITSVMTQVLKATEIDTLWMKDLWRGHEEEIIKTMVSPDDSLIFVGFRKPAKIEVYNASNGDSIRTLTFPRSASVLDDYDISKNGKYVVGCETGDSVNIIHLWDMKTGNHLRTILENDTNYTSFKMIYFIRFTPDNRYIFTSLGGKQFQDNKGDWHDSIPRFLVIDTLNWQVQREIGIARNYYYSPYDKFEISPDNKFYTSPYYQLNEMPRIELRDINNDTLISRFVDSTNKIYGYSDLKFSSDSNYLISLGGNYWYIWQIGHQNYFRKYIRDARKGIIPNCFLYKKGKIASHKYDTLAKTVRTLIYNFENENIVNEFNISSVEVHFFKTNDKFLIRDYYSLILIDSTWQTSITNNVDNHSNLLIMPNPASDFIEISVGAGSKPDLTSDVKIFDVFGQNCDLTPTLSPSGDGARLDVSGLVPGMYFVRIGDRVGKFVKM